MCNLTALNVLNLFHRIPLTAGLLKRSQERKLEKVLMAFYAQFIEPGDLCFDVGANIGNRTVVFVRLGAKVVAIEPQPACIKVLRDRFGNERRVAIVEAGLGDKEGTHEMLVGSETTVSSMSREWVERVRKSGRFGPHKWDHVIQVPITTLDSLIERFGSPAFIKIDVEGFELPVLLGLTHPVRLMSFEFTPENMENIVAALRHLASLGNLSTNYSLGESADLVSASWMPWEALIAELKGLKDKLAWGDVYVRFKR